MNIDIRIQFVIGWKYVIACVVCKEESMEFDFENNACLIEHR